MDRRVGLFGTLGVGLTALVAALVFAPDLLLGTEPVGTVLGAVATMDQTDVVLLATFVVALYLAVVARTPGGESRLSPESDAERGFERAAENPPEAVTANRRKRTAASLDADLESAVAGGGDRFAEVRTTLSRTAASARAEYEQTDRESARAAVAAGAWTDDRTAAAFLADEGPTPAVSARIRLWLAPERERRRRVDRTVAAIRRLGDDGGERP